MLLAIRRCVDTDTLLLSVRDPRFPPRCECLLIWPMQCNHVTKSRMMLEQRILVTQYDIINQISDLAIYALLSNTAKVGFVDIAQGVIAVSKIWKSCTITQPLKKGSLF